MMLALYKINIGICQFFFALICISLPMLFLQCLLYLYLCHHHVVDSIDDGAAQGRGRVHVVHRCQCVCDLRQVVRELELHPLLSGAAVLQQSHAGISVIGPVAGQVEAVGHLGNELLGSPVVLQSHPLRTVQKENKVDWPPHTAGYGRLWKRAANVHTVKLVTDICILKFKEV